MYTWGLSKRRPKQKNKYLIIQFKETFLKIRHESTYLKGSQYTRENWLFGKSSIKVYSKVIRRKKEYFGWTGEKYLVTYGEIKLSRHQTFPKIQSQMMMEQLKERKNEPEILYMAKMSFVSKRLQNCFKFVRTHEISIETHFGKIKD